MLIWGRPAKSPKSRSAQMTGVIMTAGGQVAAQVQNQRMIGMA